MLNQVVSLTYLRKLQPKALEPIAAKLQRSCGALAVIGPSCRRQSSLFNTSLRHRATRPDRSSKVFLSFLQKCLGLAEDRRLKRRCNGGLIELLLLVCSQVMNLFRILTVRLTALKFYVCAKNYKMSIGLSSSCLMLQNAHTLCALHLAVVARLLGICICLSHADIESKLTTVGSCGFHRWVG